MTVIASHTSLVILMIVKVSMVTMETARGEPCVFPFRYRGIEYYDCTTVKHDSLWCSTTYNYNQQWRECDRASSWSMSYSLQSICALEGSTVDMSCSYTYPSHLTVNKTYWINSLTDEASDISQLSQYNNRVEVNYSNKQCSLQINSVKRSDEGHYHCRITTNVLTEMQIETNGVKFSVTGLQVVSSVKGSDVKEGDNVTLTCNTTCILTPSPSLIWRKDGRPVEQKQIINNQLQLHPVSKEDEGNYTCAVEGHEDLPSTSERLSVIYSPKNTRVFTSHLGVISQGTIVNLTCSSDANPPVQNYTWFKVNESTPIGSGQQHSISNISSEDGQYYCEARNKYGAEISTPVSVEGGQSPVKVIVVAVSVSVCAVLGLVSAAVWMRFHCKGLRAQREDEIIYANNEVTPQGRTSGVTQMRSVDPKTNQTDEMSENWDPKTIQPVDIYQNVDLNTVQPDEIYQNLD